MNHVLIIKLEVYQSCYHNLGTCLVFGFTIIIVSADFVQIQISLWLALGLMGSAQKLPATT